MAGDATVADDESRRHEVMVSPQAALDDHPDQPAEWHQHRGAEPDLQHGRPRSTGLLGEQHAGEQEHRGNRDCRFDGPDFIEEFPVQATPVDPSRGERGDDDRYEQDGQPQVRRIIVPGRRPPRAEGVAIDTERTSIETVMMVLSGSFEPARQMFSSAARVCRYRPARSANSRPEEFV